MAARSVRSALFLIVVLCVVNAQTARADGLPVVGFSDGRQIVGTPGSNVVYRGRVTRRGAMLSVQSRAAPATLRTATPRASASRVRTGRSESHSRSSAGFC